MITRLCKSNSAANMSCKGTIYGNWSLCNLRKEYGRQSDGDCENGF